MKTLEWIRMMMFVALGLIVFSACSDDDDDDNVNVSDVVLAAFNEKYTGVTNVDWDLENGSYYVAEFRLNGTKHEAWFTAVGEWVMTEVDYERNFTSLPQAVQTGYNATTYATNQWTIDDIDEIQRPDYETVYKIEVEKAGQADMDLYFDSNGTLYKEVQDGSSSNQGMVSTGMPTQIQAYIDTNYAGATVIDFDRENGYYEVDIRYDNLVKELVFNSSYEWISTSTDYSRNVPALVTSAVSASYPGKVIDDCDLVETATGETYYLVDLDNYEPDLKITLDGTITEVAG